MNDVGIQIHCDEINICDELTVVGVFEKQQKDVNRRYCMPFS